MSKFKLSFSLIIALFLVGILSTVAFAKDPYGFKPLQLENGDLKVSFNGIDPTTDPASTPFDIVLKDGATTVQTYPGTLGTTLNTSGVYAGSVIIPKADLTPGKVYTLELYHNSDTTHATLLSSSTGVIIDATNGKLLNIADGSKLNPSGTSISVDKNGNGMLNDNLTGYNNTRKNRTGQKVHGFYQNNTNSCASCHQTHTGSDSRSTSEQALLFKDGVYSTCSACHDGTTGAYNNAWKPADTNTVASISGTFNVNTTGHNGSLHEADGSLRVSAAPGSNRNATTGTFAQEFDCASCHAAHGSGSNGENNLNMDPLGWASVQYFPVGADTGKKDASNNPILATKDDANGKLFKGLDIKAAVPSSFDKPFILVKVNLADQAAADANYWYKRAITVPAGGIDVIQTYRWSGETKKYVADYSLWLREKGYPFKADTQLFDGTTDPDTGNLVDKSSTLNVVWRDGFAYGTPAAVGAITSANVAIGIDVETTEDIKTLYDEEDVNYIPDSGVEMSKYCASCHTDYLAQTRRDNTGTYTQAHRHATGIDETTCVRCHFGHGSEATIMKDANDNNYFTGPSHTNDLSYFLDPNPSSALKRYTGMSVCYACHGGGEQFLGNQNNGTDYNTGAVTEKLLSGQPGETRTAY